MLDIPEVPQKDTDVTFTERQYAFLNKLFPEITDPTDTASDTKMRIRQGQRSVVAEVARRVRR